jgi:hypothetical protein
MLLAQRVPAGRLPEQDRAAAPRGRVLAAHPVSRLLVGRT